MVALVGGVLVLIAVLTGFTMAGGHIGALLHLSEVVTIGGASLGALIIMSPGNVLRDLGHASLQVIKGSPYGRHAYRELFQLLNSIIKMIRRDGLLSLDAHVASPQESALFQKYPRIAGNHRAMDFLCTALTHVLDQNGSSEALGKALETEIKVVEREHHAAIGVLLKTADALPGFGIVAAVLGIVVTMQAIDGPASEIGHKVGAALVGTFLGILLSYGFFAPLAGRMEFLGDAELLFMRAIATAATAITEGENNRAALERISRTLGSDCRPSRTEISEILAQD
jgi:chemotaxis protein MotA